MCVCVCVCARGRHADTHKLCLLVWEVCRKEEREREKRRDTEGGRQSELERKTGRKKDKIKRAAEETLDSVYYILAMLS